MQTVLVVEDDGDVADLIATVLRAHPYEVRMASSAASAKLGLQREPDLIVLDLNLPDADGFALLSEVKQTSATPVIVCSGISDKHEGTLRSLELGADDFIGKPFDAAELEARVEAVLRRCPPGRSAPDQRAQAVLQIDPRRRRVMSGDRELELTPTEYSIVLALTSQPGQVVSHEELANAVWGSQAARKDKALSSHVCSLRAKLGSAAILSAVPGFGYRLLS